MPVKDCMTGSPYCPGDKYEEFQDPILSRHEQFAGRKDTKHSGILKRGFTGHKGEHHGKFPQFAENVQQLKNF